MENQTEHLPKTFIDILAIDRGSTWQRQVKKYIKPTNPRGTVELLERFQVHRVQKVATLPGRIATEAVKRIKPDIIIHTNYSLGTRSLDALVNFATQMTSFNEAVHLLLTIGGIRILAPIVLERGLNQSDLENMAWLGLNIYLTLAQRYSRARLSLTIDRILKKGGEINPKSRYYRTMVFPSLDLNLK